MIMEVYSIIIVEVIFYYSHTIKKAANYPKAITILKWKQIL